MYTAELLHPRLGSCAFITFKEQQRQSSIPELWRKKYGEKFYECEVKITDLNHKRLPLIENLQTGEIYESVAVASASLGISRHCVRMHLYKQFKKASFGFKYLVKFKD